MKVLCNFQIEIQIAQEIDKYAKANKITFGRACRELLTERVMEMDGENDKMLDENRN
jgi:phage FluMu gp28-like protein